MKPLTLDRLFSAPDLNGIQPARVELSPDGRQVTYLCSLPDDREVLHLFTCEVETGESRVLVRADELNSADRQLSDEEKANRERKRISASGIVDYHWSPTGRHLLVPSAGRLFLRDMESGVVSAITPEDMFVTSPTFAPDGSAIAFTVDGDLYHLTIGDEIPVRLTTRRDPAVTNGVADFIAQEEMHRFSGYWWCPDSRSIAFVEVDESPVALTQRYEIDADEFGVYDQRYPYAGEANALSRLGLVNCDGTSQRWLDAGIPEDGYLGRVAWLDNRTLVTVTQTRLQETLHVNRIDIDAGRTTTIITERSDAWINLHDDFRALDAGRHFLWRSAESGYDHLALYDREGTKVRQLTEGQWCVARVVAVNDTAVYFEGFRDTPLEKHLYRVTREGSGIERLTAAGQWHMTKIDSDGDTVLDLASSVSEPPMLSLLNLGTGRHAPVVDNRLRKGHPFHPYFDETQQADFGELDSEDGQVLHYRLIPPLGQEPDKRYPVIVTVYGGPGAQLVTRQWLSPWQRYMSQRGFGLFQLDNRGSANRGNRFEHAIYRELGSAEVADQVRGVEFLKSLPWVDPDRIGVFGHSYGGYMTLKLLFRAPGVFRCGVSVAPVTDWQLYDTHYTERYMGLPAENAAGYRASGVLDDAAGLTDPLLMIHGMADDNVLFTHSTRLYKVLQDQDKPFLTMNYPGAKHGLSGRRVNLHRYGTMDRFFDEHLKPD